MWPVGMEPTWAIDPLDGTTNFHHRMRCCCVSIGLLVDRQPVLGVIYDPVNDEKYCAVKGEGATLNDKPLASSKCEHIEKALLCTGVGYDRTERYSAHLCGCMTNFIGAGCRSMRVLGSCALSMAYVAAGRLDAYYEVGICPWDVAAGAIIVGA